MNSGSTCTIIISPDRLIYQADYIRFDLQLGRKNRETLTYETIDIGRVSIFKL